jgi:putative hydroxymethylpyrimidine transport system substrate-binding protein
MGPPPRSVTEGMHFMRNRLTLLAVLAATACGGGSHTASQGGSQRVPVSLMLDWYPNADHVGVYVGIDKGFFARAGLAVDARAPSDPSDPIRLVAAGATDLGIDYEPEVFLAQQQRVPVVAVASVAPEALASIIAPASSGIHTPADLAGKTIGVDGTGSTTAFVETVLRSAGVSPAQVTLRNIGFNQVPDLLQHHVDAVAGVFRNIEGIQFAQHGLHPVVFPYDRYGVPAYDELVLVANANRLHTDSAYRRRVARFVAALRAATRWAQAHPAAATAVMEHHAYRDYMGTIKASVPATLRLLGVGPLSATAWARFGGWMYHSGLLKSPPDAAALIAQP